MDGNKNLTGTIGTENYKVKDCPFHLPKENVKMFSELQKAAKQSPFKDYAKYPNVYIPNDK